MKGVSLWLRHIWEIQHRHKSYYLTNVVHCILVLAFSVFSSSTILLTYHLKQFISNYVVHCVCECSPEEWDSLELEFQGVVSDLMWLLSTQSGSFERKCQILTADQSLQPLSYQTQYVAKDDHKRSAPILHSKITGTYHHCLFYAVLAATLLLSELLPQPPNVFLGTDIFNMAVSWQCPSTEAG